MSWRSSHIVSLEGQVAARKANIPSSDMFVSTSSRISKKGLSLKKYVGPTVVISTTTARHTSATGANVREGNAGWWCWCGWRASLDWYPLDMA